MKVKLLDPIEDEVWGRFASFLLDHHEGDIITEENLQFWLSDMLTEEEAKTKKKKYDWGKTSDNALVIGFNNNLQFSKYIDLHKESHKLSTEWIPHFGGTCPFDKDAVIVEIVLRDGGLISKHPHIVNADCLRWEHNKPDDDFYDSDIISVRFVSLREGYEF